MKISTLNISQFQYGFYMATTTEGPSAKSFYRVSGRENQRLFKVVCIQNRFNNNIVIYGNVLLKSYKQQQLYLWIVKKKGFYATFPDFFLTLAKI